MLTARETVERMTSLIEAELEPALERLAEFAMLAVDWDSYGAVPISATAIDRARTLASRIVALHASLGVADDYEFDIVPLAHGGVQLEWTISQRYLEVEISPTGNVDWIRVDRNERGRASTRGTDVSLDDIMRAAEELVTA